MVSAFTEALYEGDEEETFERFVKRCSRAMDFRAREEGPITARMPDLERIEREELAERTGWLEEAQKDLQEAIDERDALLAMTDEEVRAESEKRAEETFQFYSDINQKNFPRAERFRAMLAKVDAWTPPTPKHEGLKRFMVEQLSHHLDDGKAPVKEVKTPEAWRAEQLRYANRNVEVKRERVAKKEELLASPTTAQWLRELIDSLK